MWWITIWSWRLRSDAFVLNCALPEGAVDLVGWLWSCSIYSNVVRMFSSAVCLGVMIVQECQCFPYDHSWVLRLSKYLPAVVLHLIMQDGWSALRSVLGLLSSRNQWCVGEDSGTGVSPRNACNYSYWSRAFLVLGWVVALIQSLL